MSTRIRVSNFWRRPWRDRWLFVQVYLGLGIARLMVVILPLRYFSSHLGMPMSESNNDMQQQWLPDLRRIRWAVQRASRLTPWDSNCLPQAMVAQRYLSNKGVPTTLYLGAAITNKATMQAHAWLRCGNLIVTGAKEHQRFGAVASFASFQPQDPLSKTPLTGKGDASE